MNTTATKASRTTTKAAHITAMTLTQRQSQQIFRTLLATLSQPGRILKFAGLNPQVIPALWLPLSLADVDISIAVEAQHGNVAKESERRICELTGAHSCNSATADLVAFLDTPTQVPELKTVDAYSPQNAPRLSLQVKHISDSADGSSDKERSTEESQIEVELSGPGIKDSKKVYVTVDTAEVDALIIWLKTCGTNSGNFPAGFDIWLTDNESNVMAISRTTTVEVNHRSHCSAGETPENTNIYTGDN